VGTGRRGGKRREKWGERQGGKWERGGGGGKEGGGIREESGVVGGSEEEVPEGGGAGGWGGDKQIGRTTYVSQSSILGTFQRRENGGLREVRLYKPASGE